ncbi:MAG: 2-phosphosulfolactate phosphatase [Actinomycetota bacterium]
MGDEAARTSDVADDGSGASFDPWPSGADVHVEWGPTGALLAARRGDMVVIADVLSFSTSVTEVVARNGVVFCYSPEEVDAAGGQAALAARHDARVLSKQRRVGPGEISLSPASLGSLASGERVVMTSLNGGRCVACAAAAPWVTIGALTNRNAVARQVEAVLAAGVAERCTIVPCAEMWSAPFIASQVGDLPNIDTAAVRPSMEDQLGAGAIVDALDERLGRSVEADTAASVFATQSADLESALAASVSGRELVARGFADDVAVAARLDAHAAVPSRRRDDPAHRFSAIAEGE